MAAFDARGAGGMRLGGLGRARTDGARSPVLDQNKAFDDRPVPVDRRDIGARGNNSVEDNGGINFAASARA